MTSEQLNAQAKAAYDRAEQAGVLFDPTSVADLGGTIRQSFTANPKVQFDPVLHPRINRVLQRIDEVANEAAQNGTPISFSQVELLRRVARTAANSMDKDERRLGYDLIRQIDGFVEAPPQGAVIAGQAPDAATALKEARTAWRRMSQADALDTLVDRARRMDKPFSLALRDKAKQVADNPNRMRSFDKDVQKEIDSLARGQGVIGATGKVGHLAPSFDIRNMRFGNVLAGGTGGAFYSEWYDVRGRIDDSGADLQIRGESGDWNPFPITWVPAKNTFSGWTPTTYNRMRNYSGGGVPIPGTPCN